MCFIPPADVDYESLSATVTFPPSGGSAVQCQNVTLLDDNLEEGDETFQVEISDSDCQILGMASTVTIVDDGTMLIYYEDDILFVYIYVVNQKPATELNTMYILCNL